VQSTGTDRGGFYISTGTYPGIYLRGKYYNSNDGDDYIYSQYIVNSKSVNLTPFSQLKVTFRSNYGRGSDGLGGECRIVLLNTSKSTIKSSSQVSGGYFVSTVVSLDVSSINVQAFFRIQSESVMATYGEMIIEKIEFTK